MKSTILFLALALPVLCLSACSGDTPYSCATVVENIASFNPGSGASERNLWNKMCAEMSDDEKACVVAAKDMAAMKDCMSKKKLK